MKKFKNFNIKFNIPKDINCFTTLLLVSIGYVFIEIYRYFRVSKYIDYDWIEKTNEFLGIALGMIVSVGLLFILIRKLKLKLVSLILLIVAASALFLIAASAFKLVYTQTRGTYDLDLNISSYATVFYESFLLGFFVSSAVYLFLTRYHSPNLIVVPFLIVYSSTIYWLELEVTVLTFTLFVTLLTISIVIISFYFIARYKIKLLYSLKKSPFYLLLVFLLTVSFFTAQFVNDLYHKKAEKVKQTKREQQLNNEKADDKWDLGHDLDFAPRKGKPQSKIVGYYKAREPIYLKTNVFRVVAFNDYFDVSKLNKMNYSWKRIKNYKNKSQQKWNIREAEIVYKHGTDQILPSPEKIVELNGVYELSEKNNLLKCADDSIDCFDLASYKFKYTSFDEEIFNFEVGEQYNKEINFYDSYSEKDFTYVYSESENYFKIKNLAQKITIGLESDLEKAEAIEQYLKNNYYYSKSPGINEQEYPIDDFLLESKKGYCSYFAVGMAIMLNMVDIDSRVVGGYHSDLYSQEVEAYILLSSELHAWVEVYVDGYGWVTFDPTSARCVQGDKCGRGEGFENFSGLSENELRELLREVKANMGFDDLEEAGDMKEEWEEAENEKEKEEKKKRDEKMKEYEKKQQEKLLKVLICVCGSVLVVVFIILFLIFMYEIYKRVAFRDYYKDRKIKQKVRKLDKKLRQKIIRNFKLKKEREDESAKDFLAKLEKVEEMPSDLFSFYKTVNKILYSRKYTKRDFYRVRKIYRKLRKSM